MSSNEKVEEASNKIANNTKKEVLPSSLKNNQFKGLTSAQIINKYEDVLLSREKQFFELSNEITKLTQTIQNLVEKKNKSKYNNDKLKEILEKNQKILKQELSNKEIAFMKLTELEHKYDDLQNKIDDIINKQNALVELKERNEDEENRNVILENKKNMEEEKNIINSNNHETELIKEEPKENNNIIKEVKNESIRENKNIDKNIIEKEKNDSKKPETQEKKQNTYISAKERLNRLKEKKEKVQKLNLAKIINQTSND